MVISAAEEFYRQDRKKYVLEGNKEFLKWLKKQCDKGFTRDISFDDMQKLINNLVTWYEIKYPNREMEYEFGTHDVTFCNIEKISDTMDMQQLMYRLPYRQLSLLRCWYRGGGYCRWIEHKDEQGKLQKCETMMAIRLKVNNEVSPDDWLYDDLEEYIYIPASRETGKIVVNKDVSEIVDGEEVTLDELLEIVKNNYKEEYDCSKLERIVNNHKIDLELRKKILQLTALAMLYSENTFPEFGYIRACKFISEFNENFPELQLTTDEIDKIMDKNYLEEYEIRNNVVKRKIRRNERKSVK